MVELLKMIESYGDAPAFKNLDGENSYEVTYRDYLNKKSDNAFEVYAITLPSGASTKRGSYGHVGQELGVVSDGEIELVYESNRYVLQKGDSVAFSASAPHALENNTNEVARAIWVVTPPQRFVDRA